MAKRRRKVYEFKPDRQETGLLKQLYLTRLQRMQLLKWGTLSALCVLMLIVQDVLMSQIRISGATTDLVVCVIFLIGLYEGTENGSLFALIASIVYLFSGSSPGAQCIGLLSCTTVVLNLMPLLLHWLEVDRWLQGSVWRAVALGVAATAAFMLANRRLLARAFIKEASA